MTLKSTLTTVHIKGRSNVSQARTLTSMSILCAVLIDWGFKLGEREGECASENKPDNSGSGEKKMMCPECETCILNEDDNGDLMCCHCGFAEEACKGGACSL